MKQICTADPVHRDRKTLAHRRHNYIYIVSFVRAEKRALIEAPRARIIWWTTFQSIYSFEFKLEANHIWTDFVIPNLGWSSGIVSVVCVGAVNIFENRYMYLCAWQGTTTTWYNPLARPPVILRSVLQASQLFAALLGQHTFYILYTSVYATIYTSNVVVSDHIYFTKVGSQYIRRVYMHISSWRFRFFFCYAISNTRTGDTNKQHTHKFTNKKKNKKKSINLYISSFTWLIV